LIGTKVFLNEFIAYEKLAALITKRDNGTIPQIINGEVQWVNERTEAIVTYALCGFANVGSIGIMLGGLGEFCMQCFVAYPKIFVEKKLFLRFLSNEVSI